MRANLVEAFWARKCELYRLLPSARYGWRGVFVEVRRPDGVIVVVVVAVVAMVVLPAEGEDRSERERNSCLTLASAEMSGRGGMLSATTVVLLSLALVAVPSVTGWRVVRVLLAR